MPRGAQASHIDRASHSTCSRAAHPPSHPASRQRAHPTHLLLIVGLLPAAALRVQLRAQRGLQLLALALQRLVLHVGWPGGGRPRKSVRAAEVGWGAEAAGVGTRVRVRQREPEAAPPLGCHTLPAHGAASWGLGHSAHLALQLAQLLQRGRQVGECPVAVLRQRGGLLLRARGQRLGLPRPHRRHLQLPARLLQALLGERHALGQQPQLVLRLRGRRAAAAAAAAAVAAARGCQLLLLLLLLLLSGQGLLCQRRAVQSSLQNVLLALQLQGGSGTTGPRARLGEESGRERASCAKADRWPCPINQRPKAVRAWRCSRRQACSAKVARCSGVWAGAAAAPSSAAAGGDCAAVAGGGAGPPPIGSCPA